MTITTNDLAVKATDNGFALVSLLQQALIVAENLGDAAFAQWLRKELSGYDRNEELLAPYRVMAGQYVAVTVTGVIPIAFQGSEMDRRFITLSVAALEDVWSSRQGGDIVLLIQISSAAYSAMDLPPASRVGFRVASSSLAQSLGAIRQHILDWAIRASKHPALVSTPSPTPSTTVVASPEMTHEPTEIRDSLLRFRADYPDPKRVAFLIMRFGSTPAHAAIVTSIRSAFARHGITVVRADDKQYHHALFFNIQTYMHGCDLGIALFERIETEDFNPNVSLEVGYMMAQAKPVCLLKDRTLQTLHTDLLGHLYKTFDPQNPQGTIPPEVTKWLSDWNIATVAEFLNWASGRWHLQFGNRGQEEDLQIFNDGKYITGSGRQLRIDVQEYEPGERVVFVKHGIAGAKSQTETLEISKDGNVMEGRVKGGHRVRYERPSE